MSPPTSSASKHALKLVVMGTGPFAVPMFQALLQSPHAVAAVVTRPAHAPAGRRPPPNPMRDAAAAAGVPLGFEPEPGMFVDSVTRCAALRDRMAGHPALALTLDTGHTECMGERPAADVLRGWPGRLVNVHVDDMLACRHEHLPLGTGDVDFAGLFAAFSRAGYSGGLHVELPRQSHCWLDTARRSAAFLQSLLRSTPWPEA